MYGFTAPDPIVLAQGGVSTQQQLLARLAPGVERSAATCAPPKERLSRETAVFASKGGHPLRGALVDDVDRHLRQAVDVGLRPRKSPPFMVS